MRFKGSGLGLDSFVVCFAVGGFSSVVPEKQKSLNQGMYFNSCISRDPTVMYKLLCKVYIPLYGDLGVVSHLGSATLGPWPQRSIIHIRIPK